MQAHTLRLSAAVLICAFTGSAHGANPPKVTGAYAFQATTYCASTLKMFKNSNGLVTDLAPTQNGLVGVSIGYINFTPASAGALNGNATITGSTLVEGAAFRVEGKSAFAWTSHSDNQGSVAYSFTGSTFIYGGTTFQMVYADPLGGSGIYQQVYLVRRSPQGGNSDCVESISATKVTN